MMAGSDERRGRWWRCAAACLAAATAAGCAQNTESASAQPTTQMQQPISDQAAQGAHNRITTYIINAPGENGIPTPEKATYIDLVGDGTGATVASSSSSSGGNETRDTRAGYVQSGLTINITTGGETGGQTSGGASGQASTPGSNVTQTPDQRPEGSVQVPISAAAPGGAASSGAAGTTGGGANALTSEQQAELRTLLHRAADGDAAALARLAEILLQQKANENPPGGGPE